MSNKHPYEQTKRVYQMLGSQYLAKQQTKTPYELNEFIAQLRSNATVLDIGCAGGRDSKVFADHECTVVGIDVVQAFLDEARKFVPHATFKNMDVLHLDFPAESFDAIWVYAVLLHIARKDAVTALTQCYRVLKKDGIMCVAVKEGVGEGFIRDALSPDTDRFFVYFAKEEMERYCTEAGFAILRSGFQDDLHGRDLRWIVLWLKKQ